MVYLDFDGEKGPFPGWGTFDAAPAGGTNADFFNVWKMVCEDYQGFNINITTDRKVYDNAAQGRRMHCIITPTTNAAPGAGGVAYLRSFNSTGENVCWAFYSTGKSSAEVISHEVGHTLGLSHDGRVSPAEDYYGGHGSGATGWAPIMGVGYYKTLSQWSKGEYLSANQKQDDLSIITNNNNNVAYRTDDAGDNLASASYLEIAANNTVSNEGIIERTGDIDAFRFVTTGGQATINVNTVSSNPNLDILAEIVNAATLAVVTSDNPDLATNASVSANLPAGEYLLRVRGTGRGDPLVDGYTNYGSLGSYLITGSVAGGIKSERFSIAENSANGSNVGTVVPRNNHAGATLIYALTSGNVSGAFNINSATGAITVANSSALNYESLSLRWDDPATFELFVSITDDTNPALSESLRTVVTITNLNEAPTVTGGAVSILEHTLPGTNVFKVSGSDVDRFDFPTYSIVSGNPGNIFAIDSGTGQLTVAANIDVASDTTYNITIQATDQGTPAATATANVAVTVINIAGNYQTGRIVRTYFDNISGGTVANLTGNSRFPNTPDSQEFLTSFDGGDHGDNYGSTIRGYVIPPASGNYQFWIASDDSSELRISTNSTPGSATVRASLSGSTSRYNWTAKSSQQSALISLTAGVAYYIEARHKEGGGADHVAVAWSGPGISRQVIAGLYLAPYYQNYAPKIVAASYTVREDSLPGQTLGAVTGIDVNAQDSFSNYTITAGNTGAAFGINPASGVLYVAQPGVLNAVTKPSYTLTIQTTDNGTPSLNGSGTVTVNVTPSSGINVTGIVQEIWTGISGTALSSLTGNANYPYRPTLRRTLTSFDTISDYADNYGDRIRAKFIPPTSGAYTFYVSGDDETRLLFSANETGAGAAQIAYLTGYSSHNEWTKFSTQTSAVKTLVAGQAVYLETLHKEGNGGDHVSVGYTSPDTADITVIPGSMLLPFNINAAPVFAPTNYTFNLNGATAIAGTTVGSVTATEPNAEPLIFAIASGNAAGAFAISSGGIITVANPAALINGNAILQVAVQDGGLGGAYPLASATATVTVKVTGLNEAPVFATNPFSKPNATEDLSYSQSVAGSATDPNAGDTLTFSKTSGPSWLVVAPNGALSGTPLDASVGVNSFVVRATDGGGLFAEATLNIAVIGVNKAPSFTANPINLGALRDMPFSGSVTATDPDAGDTLIYTKVSGPAWLTVATTGTLGGTPLAGNLGANAFTLRVTDAGGLYNEATLNIDVFNNPTWTNVVGGVWPTSTNWRSGIVGDGADRTIDFSTLDLTANRTVNLNGARTVGNLIFADTTPNYNWTLSNGTGGPLTFAVTSGIPSITVINQTATLATSISGTQGLMKSGPGTLVLGGVNSFTGGLTVNEGTVRLAGTNSGTSQAGSGTLTIGTGAIVEAASYNSLGQLGGPVLSPLVIHGGTFLADVYNQINSITLTGGTLGVRSGVVQVDGMYLDVRSSAAPTVTTLESATTSTISSVLTLHAGTAVAVADGLAATDLLVSGAILGQGSLTKTGLGTLKLTGTNSYNGSTTVSDGTLVVTGSQASPNTIVSENGTLGGTGPFAGTVLINGTLAPGVGGPGKLTVSNTVTLAPNVQIDWDIADWTGSAGTGFDSFAITSLNIIATSEGPITIRIAGLDPIHFTEAGKAFTMASSAGGITGFDPAKFQIDATGFTGGAGTWSIRQTGNDIELVYTRTNTAPSFATDPIQLSATQDLAFSGSITATDNDADETLVYTKLTGPAWLTVSIDGQLSGTPANADVGPQVFTIQVTDSFNASAIATLNITVANINDAPAFTNSIITGSGATQDIPYSYNLAGTATDPDVNDTLTYSKVSGPAWLSVAESGALTGTPGSGDIGPNSFMVRVTDAVGLSADASLEIEVAATALVDTNANGILDTWEIAKFGSAGVGEHPADGDPDGDGLSNLLEFALNTHPAEPNASPLTLSIVTVGADQYLQLTAPKNPEAINLTFTIEVTDDLAGNSWSAVPTVIVSETASELVVRDQQTIQSAPRRFMRLNVRTAP